MCKECGCHSDKDNTVTLYIGGMSCDHCRNAVSGALEAVDGISDVSVSLENNSATFSLAGDSGHHLAEHAKDAIIGAGYTIVGL